jgi:zinc protease
MTLQRLFPSLLVLAGTLMLSNCNIPTTDNTVLFPVKDDPTISFRIWIKAGTQDDPAGKEGLAMLTANLMSDGATATNSYEQILEKLYPLAAGYSFSVDKEMIVASGRVHKDKLDQYYPLFLDAILHPAFNPDDFQRIKNDMLTEIEKNLRYSSDEELGKAAFYDFVYAGTPYGHLNGGTVESLNGITIEDVKSFYAKHIAGAEKVIGLGGGYDDALIGKLKKDLTVSVKPAAQEAAKLKPAAIKGLQMRIVEKDCDATAISFGFPISVVRGDEDYFALALFNSWFGEHRNSSSHLYQVIRERRGMNYGDYSYIEIFPNGGRLQMPRPNNARRQQLFEVWIRPVQHAHRHFALRAAIRELQNVIDKGMTQSDFDLTKKFLVKYARHYASTTSERLGYAIDSRFYGIDDDYIELFRKRIEALKLEDVNAAIKRHLSYRDMKIAVVTKDGATFKAALVANTPSPMEYQTPKPETVLAEDKIIAVYPLTFQPENIEIVPVEKMFQK